MEEIEKQVQKHFSGWPKYSKKIGIDAGNTKRMLESNLAKIKKLNVLLSPIGLVIKVVKK